MLKKHELFELFINSRISQKPKTDYSINGQDTFSVNESLGIGKAWKDAKDRRRVNDRVNISGRLGRGGE